jgi:hypothetical protein
MIVNKYLAFSRCECMALISLLVQQDSSYWLRVRTVCKGLRLMSHELGNDEKHELLLEQKVLKKCQN